MLHRKFDRIPKTPLSNDIVINRWLQKIICIVFLSFEFWVKFLWKVWYPWKFLEFFTISAVFSCKMVSYVKKLCRFCDYLFFSLFRFLYFLIWLCMSLLELMTWSLGCYRTWSFQEILQIIWKFLWKLFENFDKLLEHFCDMASLQ